MLKAHMVLIALLVLSAGCARIDYIGDEFPPTQTVDLYYSENDVRPAYAVMGHITATGDALVSVDKLRKELIKKARAVGADGVIIHGLDRYRENPKTEYKETTTTKDQGGTTVSTTTATTSTTTEEVKQIKAVFIKYK